MDDWEAAWLLLAGDLEGHQPPAAADLLRGLYCLLGLDNTELQGLEPPIRRSFIWGSGDLGTLKLPRAWPGPALVLSNPDDIHGGQVYPK